MSFAAFTSVYVLAFSSPLAPAQDAERALSDQNASPSDGSADRPPNVLFISTDDLNHDLGCFLGEKGLWKKQSNFERVARAPLIIRVPGMTDGGKSVGGTCSRPVEFVDIYPTLADLCGLPRPDDLAGTSLRPLLADPDSDWDRPAFTQVRRGRNVFGYSIRTQRWRYTEWGPQGREGVELYDHETDPDEATNLAASPEYADQVAELRTTLRELSDRRPQP